MPEDDRPAEIPTTLAIDADLAAEIHAYRACRQRVLEIAPIAEGNAEFLNDLVDAVAAMEHRSTRIALAVLATLDGGEAADAWRELLAARRDVEP